MTLSPRPKRSLDILTVASPCEEDWEGMSERGLGTRHCGMCMQNVYDLSAMTRAEAETLAFESTGKVCIRFYRRADGTVVTSDCAPIRHRALRRMAGAPLRAGGRLVGACLALLAVLGVSRAAGFDVMDWVRSTSIGKACLPHDTMGEAMMGDMAMPEPVESHIEFEDPAPVDG